MYKGNTGNERGDDQARRLLHELANDLAAIQMRADLLIGIATSSEALTSSLVRADLVVIRTTAAHAITTAEQFGLINTRAERPAIDGSDV
jgi:hypothetical protein